jgi:hypothetical protein
MGGVVKFIMRETSGKVHYMNRWTNIFPEIIHSSAFFNEDKDYIENIVLKQWIEMENDYQENKKTKQFKYPMTSVYFPSRKTISYSEYGIIFVDFITKKVISCNHYTSLNSVYLYKLGKQYADYSPDFNLDDYKNIVSFEVYNMKTLDKKTFNTFEELVNFANICKNTIEYVIPITVSGWTFVEYREKSKNVIEDIKDTLKIG